MKQHNQRSEEFGFLSWQKKFIIHLDHHEHNINFLFHLLGTPILLFGIFILLFPVHVQVASINTNAGTILGIILFSTYFFINSPLSFFYGGIFCTFELLIPKIMLSPIQLFSLGIALIFIGYILQVTIGHSIFEKGKNNLNTEFQDFTETGNPVIFMLIFFFPYLQLYYKLGMGKRQFNRISFLKNQMQPLKGEMA